MNADLIDRLMEKSVIPSFTSIGPYIRKRLFRWTPLENLSLAEKVVVLSGGTSGIGAAAAALYASLGATLVIVARNPEKARAMIASLRDESGNPDIHAVLGDLSVRDDVHRIARELAERFPVIDVLAHNAGALFNERRRAPNGTDLTVELMVATPFLLTGLLLTPLRKACPGRVLTMSSGGMYTQALNMDELEMSDEKYQGSIQYARAKRAQVVLNELWAARIRASEIVFHSLHPGWVNTPGIAEALPRFSTILGPAGLLRSPRDGADTLVWLSAHPVPGTVSGKFWHDRAVRRIDMTDATRKADTPQQRQALWNWCETHTQWSLPE
jgi:NAD(P)-dependent dehydrogenase (short-subunit alcohol dehydrogenase family)